MKKGDLIEAICPICEKRNAKILQIFNCDSVCLQLNINNKDKNYNKLIQKVKTLWSGDFSYFVSCQNCSFEYAFPNIPGDNDFYSIAFENDSKYPEWKWDFEIALKKLGRVLNNQNLSNFRILDIGAGNGSFLNRISETFGVPKQQMLCAELSDYGVNQIISKGIPVISSNIWEVKNLEILKKRFNIVCMFQFLEHTNEFSRLFSGINEITSNDSQLLITVPNNIHRLFFETFGLIEDVPPIHIGRWNKENFILLGNKFGWKLIEHQIESISNLKLFIKYINMVYRKNAFYLFIKKRKSVYFRKSLWIIFYSYTFLFNINIFLQIIKLDLTRLGVSQFVHYIKNY